MKKIKLIVPCAVFLNVGLQAGTSSIIERGASYDVHRVVTEYVEKGETKKITNEWTVLQTGLNYFSEGEWKSTSTEIELKEVGAEYNKGPFRLKFAPNHNTPGGALEKTLPDGRKMKMQTIGLALTDSSTGDSVWLGELQDSNGLLDGSSVIYPDAFTGVKADIVIKVSVGKYENDVVLREQILSPHFFGWAERDCKLEVWHRIIESPEPIVRPSQLRRANGSIDPDENLDFGEMLIGPGAAFLIGADQLPITAHGAWLPVAKERAHDMETGEKYLIESVPYAEAVDHLRMLPARQEAKVDHDVLKERMQARRSVAGMEGRRKPLSIAGLLSPPAFKKTTERMVASISKGSARRGPGFVMDYSDLVSQANFRFRGDATYYVTNEVNLSASTILEGGTVVKFTNFVTLSGSSPAIKVHGTINCRTDRYSPAVFTSWEDNSVGESIVGSSGTPSGWYAHYNLLLTSVTPTPVELHDIHTRYAHFGIGVHGRGTNVLYNIQAVNCRSGIDSYNNTLYVRNALIHNSYYALTANTTTNHVEHLTANYAWVRLFQHSTNSALYLTNSLVIAMGGPSVNVTEDHVTTLSSATGVFQTIGSGSHYLAATSSFRNAGTWSISPEMKAILKKGTTYPPIGLITDITTDTVLHPQAPRDTDTPDLGYVYAPIDYAISTINLTNAALKAVNGVALAGYGVYALAMRQGGKFISEGLPHQMNRIIRANVVQEQPTWWGDNAWMVTFFRTPAAYDPAPEIHLRFTEVSVLGGSAPLRAFIETRPHPTAVISIRDSQIRSAQFTGGQTNIQIPMTITLTNNLWIRADVRFEQGYESINNAPVYLSIQNNTFYGGLTELCHHTNAWEWSVHDNVFYTLTRWQTWTNGFTNNTYSAYVSSTAFPGSQIYTNLSDLLFATSHLGRFYLQSPSPVVDIGRQTNSGYVGLYHHTTQTSQTKEGTSRLDTGFHYVATDSYGLPVDTDGDGIADYLEDVNGNGVGTDDPTDFSDYNSASGLTGLIGLQTFTPIK